jgi:hypothetical protein
MSDEIVSSKLIIAGTWYPSLGESTIPNIMKTTMQIIDRNTYFNTKS